VAVKFHLPPAPTGPLVPTGAPTAAFADGGTEIPWRLQPTKGGWFPNNAPAPSFGELCWMMFVSDLLSLQPTSVTPIDAMNWTAEENDEIESDFSKKRVIAFLMRDVRIGMLTRRSCAGKFQHRENRTLSRYESYGRYPPR
jgi:hypothetical protein